jgi:hypothetical protein
MPEVATKFFCPYLNTEVELTLEREQHISQNHPDLLPEYRSRIGETLADPDEVRRSSDRDRVSYSKARRRRNRMEKKLTFQYDREADILYIGINPTQGDEEE